MIVAIFWWLTSMPRVVVILRAHRRLDFELWIFYFLNAATNPTSPLHIGLEFVFSCASSLRFRGPFLLEFAARFCLKFWHAFSQNFGPIFVRRCIGNCHVFGAECMRRFLFTFLWICAKIATKINYFWPSVSDNSGPRVWHKTGRDFVIKVKVASDVFRNREVARKNLAIAANAARPGLFGCDWTSKKHVAKNSYLKIQSSARSIIGPLSVIRASLFHI